MQYSDECLFVVYFCASINLVCVISKINVIKIDESFFYTVKVVKFQ